MSIECPSLCTVIFPITFLFIFPPKRWISKFLSTCSTEKTIWLILIKAKSHPRSAPMNVVDRMRISLFLTNSTSSTDSIQVSRAVKRSLSRLVLEYWLEFFFKILQWSLQTWIGCFSVNLFQGTINPWSRCLETTFVRLPSEFCTLCTDCWVFPFAGM
jgi:hypothetical protein